jgi:hypothetical protein
MFTPRQEIRMAIEEDGKRVIFDGWSALKGKNVALLVALAGPHEKAVIDRLKPENFPFMKPRVLVQALEVENDETVRKRVNRCRNAIGSLAEKAGDAPLPLDAVIENIPWHGYRLNPNRVRIVALSELRQGQ